MQELIAQSGSYNILKPHPWCPSSFLKMAPKLMDCCSLSYVPNKPICKNILRPLCPEVEWFLEMHGLAMDFCKGTNI